MRQTARAATHTPLAPLTMSHGLNPPQKEAVETLSGPLLVLAGAGTGKTRVVTFRIARLIRNGIRPSRILAVTFTNKAAKEMQARVRELLGKRKKDKPEISTFHSLCLRILRRHITNLGYPKGFAIYGRGDQESIARQVLREIRVDEAAMKPGDLLSKISQWKSASIRPDEAADLAMYDKDHLAAAAYRRYQKTLKASGAVDFDDLLLLTEELFENFEEVRQAEAARFDHLLVDEYQDTNGSQYRIVKALAQSHRNLCVVGDDDQSIYAWRGAEVTHILQFKTDWPEAKMIRLETNYRSTQEIINWANTLIRFNKKRHDKTLRGTMHGEPPRVIQFKDGEAEAREVVRNISTRINTTVRQPRDFAILFRTNEQTRAFEMELRRHNVPYTLVGGQSFYDRKEVRDVMAYLRLLTNPTDDVSLLRVINTPPRGIGQTTVQRLIETAVARGEPVWPTLDEAVRGGQLQPKTAAAIDRFRRTIDTFRERLQRREPLIDIVKRLIGEISYIDEINRQYRKDDERQQRWASVEEVVNAVSVYVNDVQSEGGNPTMSGFLQDSALGGPDFETKDKDSQLGGNSVAMMTLHSAKGLEFKEVYMVGLEEGTLPHHRSIGDDAKAIDEERRLCYVGITRAQLRLTLTLANARIKWGKPRATVPSRFLYEVTGQADNPNYLHALRAKELERQQTNQRRLQKQQGGKQQGPNQRGGGNQRGSNQQRGGQAGSRSGRPSGQQRPRR